MLLEWNSFMCRRLTVSHFFLLIFFQLSWGIIDISYLFEHFTWHKRNCRLFFFQELQMPLVLKKRIYSTSLILWPQLSPLQLGFTPQQRPAPPGHSHMCQLGSEPACVDLDELVWLAPICERGEADLFQDGHWIKYHVRRFGSIYS